MKKTKPKVSVIIPTLNEEKYLPHLLKSLSRQTMQEFETVVVDGNSEDKTVDKAKVFSALLSSLKVITTKKRNVSYQRNLGASHSHTPWLIFLDADVIVAKDFIEKVYMKIQKELSLLYIIAAIPEDKWKIWKPLLLTISEIVALSQYTNRPFSMGGQFIIFKPLFVLLGGFDEQVALAEDHYLVSRAKQCGVFARLFRERPVKISFRRFDSEGTLNTLRKYLLASLHLIRAGKIEHPLFEYKMGGAHHEKAKTPSPEFLSDFRNLLERAKNNLEEIVRG